MIFAGVLQNGCLELFPEYLNPLILDARVSEMCALQDRGLSCALVLTDFEMLAHGQKMCFYSFNLKKSE